MTFSNFKLLNSNTRLQCYDFKGISNFAQGQKAGFNKVSLKNTKILYLLTEITNFTSKLYKIGIDTCWYMLVYAVFELSEV